MRRYVVTYFVGVTNVKTNTATVLGYSRNDAIRCFLFEHRASGITRKDIISAKLGES